MASICCSPPDMRAGQLGAPLAEPRELRERAAPRPRFMVDAGEGDHAQVLAHGEVREDAAALGDRAHADPGQRVGRDAVDVAAGEVHAARGRASSARWPP